jgi:Fe-S cluster assembly ATP-binding protein
MLNIKNLIVKIGDKTIINDLNLNVKPGEIHAIMGPNGSGKSTLSSVIAGNEDYTISKGEILFNGNNINDLSPEQRAHKGIFLSFQYPIEIPGISVINFLKTSINETRKANNLEPLSSKDLLKLIKEKQDLLKIDTQFLSRSLNHGFSGGEKKKK